MDPYFMISILVALVQLGSIATIEAGIGAAYFGAVVVCTMFAAITFDPRLIWDAAAPRGAGTLDHVCQHGAAEQRGEDLAGETLRSVAGCRSSGCCRSPRH